MKILRWLLHAAQWWGVHCGLIHVSLHHCSISFNTWL